MATRKRNEFLETEESAEDDISQGYDSEAEAVRKGGRSSKRRRIDNDDSDDESTGLRSEDEVSNGQQVVEKMPDLSQKMVPSSSSYLKSTELPGISKPLTTKNLVATAAAIKRSGVVYLSRIPPFMKPHKLRTLLEPYGSINRIFLTPEDSALHNRRVRNGGNKKRSFTDGWVEFVNKAEAKKACELLNARIIGGKKGTYYHDDVWNLLYLKGFKWHNLTEQIAAENAERSSRLRAEISKNRKENKEFLQNVERAKMLEGMESKKAAKRRKEGQAVEEGDNQAQPISKSNSERPRHFAQRSVAMKKEEMDQSEQVTRILSKIF